MQTKVDLSNYDNSWYDPGSKIKCMIWYFINILILKNRWIPSSALRVYTLRLFGSKIGKQVVIKPGVNVKYPWKLSIGDYSWIGEAVWIDNLDQVIIGKNVCVSQGAMLLSGNHNYKKTTFNLMIAPITIETGVWVGAKTIICQGSTLKTHSVLTVGSIANGILEAYGIYKGNPAIKIKERQLLL
ncbi:WcaF family extracellular polysaccharide biosynthesis acetyltransferase [Winogradskyella sp.]|nr:WcaF family extracellular polysaccharide biosynthesis acetyltransferase [Winogradskyella sp.]MDC1505097.1 WcaF family extracellular polysaccharide biosynthesis acetyltransferase [Winogradskyella sp.]